MTNDCYDETDSDGIAKLLVGRRIVSAEIKDIPDETSTGSWFDDDFKGVLTLDDGTEILVRPNQGGCACSAGDYELTHLATVDNVITSVRLADERTAEFYDELSGAYRIYVVADNTEINVVTIEGDDGNGYYGTGYELLVKMKDLSN